MERAIAALLADAVKLEVDEAQAKRDCEVACQSKEAMQRFYSALSPDFKRLGFFLVRASVFGEGPRNEAPQDVQAIFVDIVKEHMPVLAGCLFNPPEAFLNLLVDSLIRGPVAYEAMWQIMCTARGKIYQLIRYVKVFERTAGTWHRSLQDKLLEARRQILPVRCTCKRMSAVVLDM